MSKKTLQHGFTLIELMVVVAIIALVMTFVLPNMDSLMGGESRAQAMNLVDAKLRVARAMAVREHNYVGVHFQRHYQTGEMWCAIMVLSDEDRLGRDSGDDYAYAEGRMPFRDSGFARDTSCTYGGQPYIRAAENTVQPAWKLLEGSSPSRIPGNWRVGPVCSLLNDDYSGLSSPNPLGPVSLEDRGYYDSFTVVFDPEGKTQPEQIQSRWNYMVYVPGANKFYADSIFGGASDTTVEANEKIWDLTPRDPQTNSFKPMTDTIVNALCLYSGKEYDALVATGQSAEDYLDENAAFMVVNPYVGGIIRSSVE